MKIEKRLVALCMFAVVIGLTSVLLLSDVAPRMDATAQASTGDFGSGEQNFADQVVDAVATELPPKDNERLVLVPPEMTDDGLYTFMTLSEYYATYGADAKLPTYKMRVVNDDGTIGDIWAPPDDGKPLNYYYGDE